LFEVQLEKDEFTRPFAEKRCPLLHRTLLRSMNYSCHTHALSLSSEKLTQTQRKKENNCDLVIVIEEIDSTQSWKKEKKTSAT